jgi:malonyl-CoA decarboxylase
MRQSPVILEPVTQMNESTRDGFLDRTLRNLRGAWGSIAGAARGKANDLPKPDLPDDDVDRIREQLKDCLEARGGEVSARTRAAAVGRAYLSLNEDGRKRFLDILAHDISIETEPVDRCMEAVQQAGSAEQRRVAERALRVALRPPRFKLYSQFTTLPEGVKFLVDLRAELLRYAKKDPAFEVAESELKSRLSSWFDVGFLELARIRWDSPAALLEKLIAYEAVHAIDDWDDLKNRLQSDRRCFAFFHPRMPEEPLIFVEVALVNGMADSIQKLLDKDAPTLEPQAADTAIFYSISNAQPGLAGISFGSFLIKRVVDLLAADFKGLKHFATLSPVPGFRGWLQATLGASSASSPKGPLSPAELKRLEAFGVGEDGGGLEPLLLDPDRWQADAELSQSLKPILLRLCASYLVEQRRSERVALDPVAHFHLSNGARVERLNWLGDTSAKGMQQSLGMMVNYLYKLGEIEANHEAYRGADRVKMSSSVRALLKA